MAKNPMPTVKYGEDIYKLRSRKIIIPDLESMSKIEALMWLNHNTYARGYQKEVPKIGGFTLNIL